MNDVVKWYVVVYEHDGHTVPGEPCRSAQTDGASRVADLFSYRNRTKCLRRLPGVLEGSSRVTPLRSVPSIFAGAAAPLLGVRPIDVSSETDCYSCHL